MTMRFWLVLCLVLLSTPLAAQTSGPFDRFLFNPIGSGARMVAGSGTPESVVTATIGSTFHRTDTGDIYQKVSGSGNTGWVIVYRSGGTDVAVADGGTGVSTLASNGVLYGNGTGTVLVTAAGGANTVLAANAGAPAFSSSPTVTSLTATTSLTTPTLTAAANQSITPAGDLIVDPLGNDALPNLNYDINLGSLSKKYLTLHAAELWVETLVAQNTIATIGGRVLVAPTTTLTVDLGTGDTTITVKHNEMVNGDRVYLEADGKVEFMAITSAAGGSAGAYTYSVTRNLDGSGANAWFAGDAMLNTGTTGDGFIDLYSVAGVLSGAGPTIVGNVRTGTTYNSIAPRWAIGNLNGLYGYSGSTYGATFGDASATNITIDATNGFRIRSGTTNKLVANTSGDLSLSGDLSIGTSGQLRSGATSYAAGIGYWVDYNGGTPRLRVGNPSGNRFTWDGTDLTIVSQNFVVASTGISITQPLYTSGSVPDEGFQGPAENRYQFLRSGDAKGSFYSWGRSDIDSDVVGIGVDAVGTGNVQLMATSTSFRRVVVESTVSTTASSWRVNRSTFIKGVYSGGTGDNGLLMDASGLAFSATATGALVANVRNQSGSTTDRADLWISNDAANAVAAFQVFSSGFTTSGPNVANGVYIKSNGAGGLSIGAEHGSGVVRFYSGGSTLRAQINTNGTQTWAPYGAGTATFDASGNITSVSDERLKDIRGPFTLGLNAVLGLRPILYRYLSASALDVTNTYAGFSAQNVLAYVPEAVGKSLDGLYSVNVVPVVAATVTAVQELTREVDELRAALALPARSRDVAPLVGDARAIQSETAFDQSADGQLILKLRAVPVPARGPLTALLGVPILTASRPQLQRALGALTSQQCESARTISALPLPCRVTNEGGR